MAEFDHDHPLGRQEIITGADATARLRGAAALLCGIGGVGSWAAEAMVRCGLGTLVMVDFDTIKASNLNRQLEALHSTLGQEKCRVLAMRLHDIAPECQIECHQMRLTDNNIPPLLSSRQWDVVIDCIDDRQAKLSLLLQCVRSGLRVVSSMGAAGKVHPELIRVGQLSQTDGCPVARTIRKSLRKCGVERGVTCVFSPELPVLGQSPAPEHDGERRPLGTLVTVTAAFGLRVADAALRPIMGLDELPHRGGWRPTTR